MSLINYLKKKKKKNILSIRTINNSSFDKGIDYKSLSNLENVKYL